MRFKFVAMLLIAVLAVTTFADQLEAQSGTSSAPIVSGDILPSAPSIAPGSRSVGSFVQPAPAVSPGVGTYDTGSFNSGGYDSGGYDSGNFAQSSTMPASYGTSSGYFSGSANYGPSSISGPRPGCTNCGTPCPQQTFVPPFYGDTSPALLRIRRGGPANPGVYYGRNYGRPLFGQWCGF